MDKMSDLAGLFDRGLLRVGVATIARWRGVEYGEAHREIQYWLQDNPNPNATAKDRARERQLAGVPV
jgi:hypothetical protein